MKTLSPPPQPDRFAGAFVLLHDLHVADEGGSQIALLSQRLENLSELRTETRGKGPGRCVVVLPKNAKPRSK
jgi:hypothetical protein